MDLSRYSRQALCYQVGEQGQRRITGASAVIVGCGALGCVTATLLARGGVGALRLIDRDFVELSNLQRQILYDEGDVASGMPKAAVAARKLGQANSQVEIEGVVADFNSANALDLLSGFDVVVDAVDSFEARYLINDACLSKGTPWVYGAVIGSYGLAMTVLPGKTACLRCLLPDPPAPGAVETCDTAGVLGMTVSAVASFQATEALKLLSGAETDLTTGLLQLDVWDGETRRVQVPRQPDCPACVHRQFVHLQAQATSRTASVCGRNAVQITLHPERRLDLEQLAQRLAQSGRVVQNPFMVRFSVDGCELNIFPDARAIINGTTDEVVARSLYARYVGL